MLPPKRVTLFKKSLTSITTADNRKPSLESGLEKKLFFPTFDSRDSIIFWIVFVVFFSLLSVLSSITLFATKWDAWVFFIEGLTSYACIVLFVVGYVHHHRYSLAHYDYAPTVKFFTKTILVLVPIATLLASILTYVITGVARNWEILSSFIISNVILTMIFSILLVHLFSTQYHKMEQHHAIYQQKLIEQNTQLKARITPHFFFNMLNTLQSLAESEPQLASDVIEKVAKLYRVSFSEPFEVALNDEIDLCKDYLGIEKYRFEERLQVTWALPDEDLRYDMVITSLTLQMLMEKMIISLVEITSQIMHIHVTITWENSLVTITMSANLPNNSRKNIKALLHQLNQNLSFKVQQDNLQRHFGKTATIGYHLNEAAADTPHNIVIKVAYPLTDVG